MSVLVFAEIRDGNVKGVTGELVAAAQQLSGEGAGDVSIAAIGPGADAAASFAVPVHKVDSPEWANYSAQTYVVALEAIVQAAGAKVVLFGATAMGKDLSARLAARLGASLFTDCTEVSIDGGSLKAKRPIYSGKVYAEVLSTADVQLASLRPNTFAPAQQPGGGAVNTVSVSIEGGGGQVKEFKSTSGGGKDLTEAEVIVAGGRSLKSTENFQILTDLAEVIGATVGASRAAVDAGYVPHSMQVGQTGKVVNPKLYLAVGISGAIQHLVGMRTSKVIVAINKDEGAPIFQKSDYGVVGDLFEVIPALTAEFKTLLG